jgi:hypothetical protein
VARATDFFASTPTGFIVLVRRPEDDDVERAALAAGFRAGWALANNDPGERERAPLLFHDETIVAPHIAAFVAYVGSQPAPTQRALERRRRAPACTGASASRTSAQRS